MCAVWVARAAERALPLHPELTYQLDLTFTSLSPPPPLTQTQNFRWTEEEVNAKLEKAMKAAFADVWEVHTEAKLPLRTAAFVKALQRVTRARVHRGFD